MKGNDRFALYLDDQNYVVISEGKTGSQLYLEFPAG